VGSGATFHGVRDALRERFPGLVDVRVLLETTTREPEVSGYRDSDIVVPLEVAEATILELSTFCGTSPTLTSAANWFAARQLSRRYEPSSVIVTII
jgi:cysteine synthase